MHLQTLPAAEPEKLGVALVVATLQEVRGYGTLVAIAELLGDHVPAGTPLRSIAFLDQPFHVGAIADKHGAVVGGGPRRRGQPPDVLDGILDPDAPDVHPLRRSREFRRIEPKALLSQVEAGPLAEIDQELEVVKGACGDARVVAASDVEDEAPVFAQNSLDLGAERSKPVDVPVLVDVPILLLEVQGVGR